MATVISKYPDRSIGLATVAPRNLHAAAGEIERAVELGIFFQPAFMCAFMKEAPICDEDKEKIYHLNAEKLYKLQNKDEGI